MVGLVTLVSIKHLTAALRTSLSVSLTTLSPSLPGELRPSNPPKTDRAKKTQGKNKLGFKKSA